MPEKDTSTTLERGIFRRVIDGVIWFCKDQWYLIAVAVVTIIASQVQVPSQGQALKQVIVSYLSVAIIFFITGCTLDTRILLNNYGKWRQHLFIQTGCFLLVSALAFAVVSLAATNQSFMDPWLLIGLIFNACQPTAMASNVMLTRQAHGNAPLTVVETTIGHFIGPFVSPVLIKMYLSSGAWYTDVVPPQSGGYQAMYRRVFKQFGLSIYLPMAVGQLVRYFLPKTVQKVFVDWKLAKFGSLCLLSMLWQTFDRAFATGALQNAKSSNLIFIVFISIANYFLWLAIAMLLSVLWLDRKDTVTVAMCVPSKTLALGLPLSFLCFTGTTQLDEAKLQVCLVIFQIMQLGMASLCTIILRRWVDAVEPQKQPDTESQHSVASAEKTALSNTTRKSIESLNRSQ